MPSHEGCAFYPFFPISFAKYNYPQKKFTPQEVYLSGSNFLPGCGMDVIIFAEKETQSRNSKHPGTVIYYFFHFAKSPGVRGVTAYILAE